MMLRTREAFRAMTGPQIRRWCNGYFVGTVF